MRMSRSITGVIVGSLAVVSCGAHASDPPRHRASTVEAGEAVCDQPPTMAPRATVSSLDEYRRSSDAIAVVKVVDRSVEAVEGVVDASPQRYLAQVVVEEVVRGSLEQGQELTLYLSYGEGPRHGGLTSPGLDAALEPGVVALVGLVDDEGGEYGAVGGGVFVRSRDAVRHQGVACEPSAADEAIGAEIEGLSWSELVATLRHPPG